MSNVPKACSQKKMENPIAIDNMNYCELIDSLSDNEKEFVMNYEKQQIQELEVRRMLFEKQEHLKECHIKIVKK